MKQRIAFIALFCLMVCGMYAQSFSTTPADPSALRGYEQQAIQSQRIMTTGASYSGTVYAPFDNTAPSEQGSSYSPGGSGPHRVKIDGPQTGESTESPVGEPWCMIAFAAAFGAWMAVRKRQKQQNA